MSCARGKPPAKPTHGLREIGKPREHGRVERRHHASSISTRTLMVAELFLALMLLPLLWLAYDLVVGRRDD
jgi:hypothetical protein